ncbi:hypothetical protein [Acinetobacter calcoaceticus]|uniref:hypothetical protein n=1 Tax=Acinetobacter calcoaceticus TaxID=471 RepID=UPI0005DD8984|nr:hypothetical protein [Acinetobacter calcoaceticus]KJH60667.1 hypothetical protein UF12_12100 [Acinetobacter calcoaceticus]
MSDHDTFGKLVKDDNDFVGMVAYTIYKKEKNNWKDSFKQAHSREATYDEMCQFFNVNTTTPQKVDSYRKLAEDRVNTFIDQTLASDLEQYQKIIRDDEIVKAVHTPMWKSIRDNVIAGIVGAALVSAFSIGMWLKDMKDNTDLQKQLNDKVTAELGITQSSKIP